MRLRSVLVVALAFVLGASAALGFRAFVDRRGEPAPEVDTLPVVVAVIDIARGGTITSDLIKMRETPKALAPEGALTKPEEAIGRAVASPLVKNEMVLDAKLSPKGAGRISSMIPPGMRAVTIGTPRAGAGAAGFVRPGDKVDVLLTPDDSGPHAGGGSTTTLLQGVEVLAVDQRVDVPAEAEPAARDLRSVTLLVTPTQANLIALGREKGALHLTWRGQDDELDRRGLPGDHGGRGAKSAPWGEKVQRLLGTLSQALAMARDIARRLGVEPAAIVDAVEDALAGRRPRW